jgi:hypothetical protein
MPLAAALLLAGAAAAAAAAQPADGDAFTYRQLAREDFRGEPNPDSPAAAQATTGIRSSSQIRVTSSDGQTYRAGLSEVTYEAVFQPEESWWKPEGDDPYLLRHEQGHFDITKIAECRLEQEADDLAERLEATGDGGEEAGRRVQEQFDRYLREAFSALEERQSRYDRETDYSRDREEQERWNRMIARELEQHCGLRPGKAADAS